MLTHLDVNIVGCQFGEINCTGNWRLKKTLYGYCMEGNNKCVKYGRLEINVSERRPEGDRKLVVLRLTEQVWISK